MKSHDANDKIASGHEYGQPKKTWITPCLQIIPLQSAEGGTHFSTSDGPGGSSNRPRS